MTTTTLRVAMACGGCSSAVERVLMKTPGVTGVKIDMGAQTVAVEGSAAPDVLVAAIKGAGKEVSLI